MDIILMIFSIIMIISFITGVCVTNFSKKENDKIYISVPVTNNCSSTLYDDMEKYFPIPIIEPEVDYDKPKIIEVLQFDNDLVEEII